MTFSTASIPDLTGTRAVVTGANGGLGLETAKALAANNAHVVMAVRNRDKAESAVAAIRAETPYAELTLVDLDLSSLASVEAAARSILDTGDVIDLLVNNAGVMAIPEGRTVDGFETQLATNHLGHWVLTARLLPALIAAPAARVVSVTSAAHLIGRPIDPNNPHLDGKYGPWSAYAQSKLANYHFGLGLERRFRDAGVRPISLLAHPGVSHTDLVATSQASHGASTSGSITAKFTEIASMTAARGALSQLRAATDPSARGGYFYGPLFVTRGPAVRKPILGIGIDKAVDTLWTVSERETGVPLVVG